LPIAYPKQEVDFVLSLSIYDRQVQMILKRPITEEHWGGLSYTNLY